VAGLNPILMGATNSSAGVMDKMISPQNLSVGATTWLETRYRPLFYASMFIWSYSMSEMFDSLRRVAVLIVR